MATTNINMHVDSVLKQEAKALFSHNGIPLEVKRLSKNGETKATLNEYGEMKKEPDMYKCYGAFDDL